MPPEYSSISSRTLTPAGASLTPGSLTRPETEKLRRPLRSRRPWDVNQAALFTTDIGAGAATQLEPGEFREPRRLDLGELVEQHQADFGVFVAQVDVGLG